MVVPIFGKYLVVADTLQQHRSADGTEYDLIAGVACNLAVGLRVAEDFGNARLHHNGLIGTGVLADPRREIFGSRVVVYAKALHGAGVVDKALPVVRVEVLELLETLHDGPQLEAVSGEEIGCFRMVFSVVVFGGGISYSPVFGLKYPPAKAGVTIKTAATVTGSFFMLFSFSHKPV